MTQATERQGFRDSPLQAYLNVLHDRWLVVVAVFVLTVVSAVVFTSQQARVYQASATVLIEPEPPRFVNIQEVHSEREAATDYYATQYKLLQSRPVVEPVIEQLGLKQRLPRLRGARDAYEALMVSKDTLIIDPVKNTRLVMVRFDDRDPRLAIEVANAVAAQYVKYGLEVKQREAQTATVWLNEQIQSLKAKADQSSRALQAYQSKADLLGIQDQRSLTQAKLMDFNRAYLDAQNQRLAAESKLRELTRIAKDPTGSETLSTVVNDPLIQKLKTEASDLQIERSKLAEIYREKHPDLMQLDAQIRQVNQHLQAEIQKLLRGLESDVKVARGKEESLLGKMDDLRREARLLNEREAQTLSLQREKESVEELQATVLKRLKETGVTSALTTSNIRIVERAMLAVPVRPRIQLIWSLAAVAGLALGVGVAFLTDSLDDRARSRDDIERVLGVPIIGIVPMFRVRRHDARGRGGMPIPGAKG